MLALVCCVRDVKVFLVFAFYHIEPKYKDVKYINIQIKWFLYLRSQWHFGRFCSDFEGVRVLIHVVLVPKLRTKTHHRPCAVLSCAVLLYWRVKHLLVGMCCECGYALLIERLIFAPVMEHGAVN